MATRHPERHHRPKRQRQVEFAAGLGDDLALRPGAVGEICSVRGWVRRIAVGWSCPTFYPDDINSVPERYAWGRAHIEKLVSHPGYHQFFAVHETEAWLLSDLQRFQPDVRRALIEKSKNPETINLDEPPAKLLDRVYMSCKKRHYEKVIEARNQFPHLDPSVAATKCPYLRQMLNELLTIIQDARTQGPQNYA